MTKRTLTLVSVVALAIALAACGSSSKKNTTSASSAPSKPAAAPSTTSSRYGSGAGIKVSLRKVSFGKVLVGPNSHTVYLFLKDTGTTSQCNGKCAVAWMPLTSSGQTQAGPGLNQSMFGTSKRKDGTMQVTYGGHPLYYYDDDKKPGTTEGEGKKEFGAEWYAVGADGKKVEKTGSS
jgi:predicted lipoprotein with Yx(FWY)xxD motif